MTHLTLIVLLLILAQTKSGARMRKAHHNGYETVRPVANFKLIWFQTSLQDSEDSEGTLVSRSNANNKRSQLLIMINLLTPIERRTVC